MTQDMEITYVNQKGFTSRLTTEASVNNSACFAQLRNPTGFRADVIAWLENPG